MGAGASTDSGAPPTAEDLQRLNKEFLGVQKLYVIHSLTSTVGEELNGRCAA